MLDFLVEDVDQVGDEVRRNLLELLVVFLEFLDALEHLVLLGHLLGEALDGVRVLCQPPLLNHALRLSRVSELYLITKCQVDGHELVVQVPQLYVHIFREFAVVFGVTLLLGSQIVSVVVDVSRFVHCSSWPHTRGTASGRLVARCCVRNRVKCRLLLRFLHDLAGALVDRRLESARSGRVWGARHA